MVCSPSLTARPTSFVSGLLTTILPWSERGVFSHSDHETKGFVIEMQGGKVLLKSFNEVKLKSAQPAANNFGCG